MGRATASFPPLPSLILSSLRTKQRNLTFRTVTVTVTVPPRKKNSGGAAYVSAADAAASNVTVTFSGGRFASNSAGGDGGHVLATGNGTAVYLRPSAAWPVLVLSDGDAGSHGGAVAAAGGAAVSASSAELSGNRAGGDGGAVTGLQARLIELEGCNVTANSCGGSGGGVSVTGGVLLAAGSNFTGNRAEGGGGGVRASTEAEVDLEDCLFQGNLAQVGWLGGLRRRLRGGS